MHGVSVFANSPSLSLKHSFSFSLWPKKSDTVNYRKNLFSLPIQTFLFGMFFSIQLTIISTDHSNDGIFHTIRIWIEAKTQISHHFVWLFVCLCASVFSGIDTDRQIILLLLPHVCWSERVYFTDSWAYSLAQLSLWCTKTRLMQRKRVDKHSTPFFRCDMFHTHTAERLLESSDNNKMDC